MNMAIGAVEHVSGKIAASFFSLQQQDPSGRPDAPHAAITE
jgi:uncharacterized membrane protein